VVQGEPRIRFFVGAPLVASNGHRLGTLCYLGPQPRVTTAEEAMILANMAGAGMECCWQPVSCIIM
jgi:GAF domain-containing protein